MISENTEKAKSDEQNPEETIQTSPSEAEQRAQEYLGQLQRLQAEFDNYHKRVTHERGQISQRAKEELIVQLLNIADNLERALQATGKNKDIVQGVTMIFNQLMQLLHQEGVTSMTVIGERFNPLYHEALTRIPSNEEEHTVIEEFQKGYKIHDKIIRHAKVGVSIQEEQKNE